MDLQRRLLPLFFVIAGTFNVVVVKWSDNIQTISMDGKQHRFQHPVVQTAFMFLGQFLCFVIYKIIYFFIERRGDGSENSNLLTRGGRELSPVSFLLPAFLDAVSSILLFSGLYLTYMSTFQMLRAAAIIFVGIFSSIHMNQRLTFRHWMAVFTLTCGFIVLISIDVERVLYDKVSLPHPDENAILAGNFLIILAQVFQGLHFVYEEKHIKEFDLPPMLAVGWQGIFGLLVTFMLGLCLNYLPMSASPFGDNPSRVFDDIPNAFFQLHNNGTLIFIMLSFALSSAIYNFSALSIVKFSSTPNRLLCETLRMILVWWWALVLEWECFNLVSLMGFLIIIMGTVAYRNAIFLEWYRSLLARLARNRYSNMNPNDADNVNNDGSNGSEGVPVSRPADLI